MKTDWQRQPFSVKVAVVLFVIGLLLVYAGVIHATELRTQVAGDAHMDELFASQQTGTTASLEWGRRSDTRAEHPWFKADISGVPAGATIDSVKMKVYFTTVLSNGDVTCSLFACATNATEGGVTWDSANRGVLDWTANGGDYDTLMAAFTTNCGFGVDCYYTFSMTASGVGVFQDWLDGARNNYGMVGRNDALGVSLRDFNSNNGTNPDSILIYYTAGAGGPTGIEHLKSVYLKGVYIR